MEGDTSAFAGFSLLAKQSEELSYPFRSVQCALVAGSKQFFAASMGVLVDLKLVSVADHY